MGPCAAMDKMRHLMTFELIQQTLGVSTTNKIAEAVLLAANGACDSDDPRRHDDALLELMTALQAVILQRRGADRFQAEDRGARLCELVEAMASIDKSGAASDIVVH